MTDKIDASIASPIHRPSIRVSKAAELLQVNISTIYRLAHNGTLQAHRIGTRGLRIFADSLRQFQEDRKLGVSSASPQQSAFQETKNIASSNSGYRDAVAYLEAMGCLK